MRGLQYLWEIIADGEFGSLTNALVETGGATAIEYGLIAALIAVAAVVVMGTVGTNLSNVFNSVATQL